MSPEAQDEMKAPARPRIGLFYGSSTCYTEMAAEQIAAALSGHTVELWNLATTPLRAANDYRLLILGIPTWDYGELQEDWERAWPQLAEVDWPTKTVALFGLGDQEGYPEWFQDALGYLAREVAARGARLVGLWPAADYRFTQSQALTPDSSHFLGLALDEATEFEQSAARIQQWCAQLAEEFRAG
ncbi:MAG TPA: flavodoxin FldB [Porticoccaceae bacterium]|nr:flavodoxin FldB [Porticoccaceae bacterium]